MQDNHICKRCSGRGYSQAEAPVIKDVNRGKKGGAKMVTLAQGSGCIGCKGTGVIS